MRGTAATQATLLLPAKLFQQQGQRSNILKYGFKSETSGERSRNELLRDGGQFLK